MMRLLLILLLSVVALSSAQAQDSNSNMIFREDAGLTQAEYFLASGKYAAALDAADTVLKRRPQNADALTYKGYALARLGQTDEAVKNFQHALTLVPTHLGANKYLADTYLAKGDTARALEQLQVIRLACAGADCPELRALERAIDQTKTAPAKDKKEK